MKCHQYSPIEDNSKGSAARKLCLLVQSASLVLESTGFALLGRQISWFTTCILYYDYAMLYYNIILILCYTRLLYSTILYYTILYYTILYYTILQCHTYMMLY